MCPAAVDAAAFVAPRSFLHPFITFVTAVFDLPPCVRRATIWSLLIHAWLPGSRISLFSPDIGLVYRPGKVTAVTLCL